MSKDRGRKDIVRYEKDGLTREGSHVLVGTPFPLKGTYNSLLKDQFPDEPEVVPTPAKPFKR